MLRRHALILFLTAALVAACTSPTAPRTPSYDEQITIGPHPNVIGGDALRGH
ncbi:MAG TPA: hypothetical protein VJO52_15005 [Gemmatimonadaceae bacterium]|nr:hypothetical protein [Gemmatimonadaceae bacterium]